jgi:hypothetical protein
VEKIEEDISEYRSLLDSSATEQRVHEFLASHSYFFNGILRLFGASPLYSKVRLGSEYEIDFVCFDTGSFGPEWYLIEIEAPSARMFTKSGNPTAPFTHAIQQVRDWHAWLQEHLSYARKLMPQIEYPLGYVFIGRRASLTPADMRRFRRLAYEHRTWLRIHTFDRLEDTARSVTSLVRAREGGTWPVPMHALTHVDLAAGRPDIARKYLSDSSAIGRKEYARRLMLNQRKYGYLDKAEFP